MPGWPGPRSAKAGRRRRRGPQGRQGRASPSLATAWPQPGHSKPDTAGHKAGRKAGHAGLSQPANPDEGFQELEREPQAAGTASRDHRRTTFQDSNITT